MRKKDSIYSNMGQCANLSPRPKQPNVDRFQYHVWDTGSNLCWSCLGMGLRLSGCCILPDNVTSNLLSFSLQFKTCNVLETFWNCYFGHSHSLPVCISHVCLQELITHLVNKIGIHRERQYVTVVPYMVLKLTRYWPVSYGWPSKGHISFSDCFRGLHCCSPSSSTSSHHKYEITVRNIWSIYTTYPTSICATKNAVSLLWM